MHRPSCFATTLFISLIAASAYGQAEPAESTTTAAAIESKPEHAAPFTLGGYVEAQYQWNFNRPSNDITNYRGFDNRHNTFTLANVALDVQWDYEDVIGRLTVQVGHTPSTYYLAEPQRAGASGANATGAELWKYLQQAYAGYRLMDDLTVTAGLFLSPIGPESMAVRDNWNWSRSNLFFGLPFYHTGARATYTLVDDWAVTLAAYNGWNSVVDNNPQKSLSAQATLTRPELSLSLLYFGGVERPHAAAEGTAWRHLFDAHATWPVTRWLSLLAHANSGFERTTVGSARWLAGALYARAQLADSWFVATRGDMFYERVPQSGGQSAGPIFWPVSWVSSGTVTLEYRPRSRVSFRLEYRHDQADAAMFFGQRVAESAETSSFIANRRAQDTLTLGTTAWF